MADAVVIGAGHNGLACACYLAKAGLGVAVFEEYSAVGGMTLTEELAAPGFWSDVHASGYQLASLSPAPSDLNLFDHGLEPIEPEYAWAHAFRGGGCILVGADLEHTRASRATRLGMRAPPWSCSDATEPRVTRSSGRSSRPPSGSQPRCIGWRMRRAGSMAIDSAS